MSASETPAILGDRRVPWLVALVFLVAGVEAVFSARYLHDEGVLTWYFASIVRQEPVAGLFFQKARPVLAAGYAPISGAGFRAFALVHVLVCTASIPAIAAIARRLELPTPNVAAVVLAGSPLLLATAPGGHSNADAMAGLVLAMWLLLVCERPLACGAVLGCLLLVRSEAAVFVIAIALDRALRKDYRVAMGVAAVPAIYALAGSIYHRDLLWVLHYPPTLAMPAPNLHWFTSSSTMDEVGGLGESLFALSPALWVAALVRPREIGRTERAWALGLVAFLVAIRGFPIFGLFNFDTSPRYLLIGLPVVALLVTRVVGDSYAHRAGGRGGLGVLAVAILIGVGIRGDVPQHLLLMSTGIAAASLALARAARPSLALAAWLIPALAVLPVSGSSTRLDPPMATLDRIEVAWREQLVQEESPIVTNARLLRPWLVHWDLHDEDRRPVHFILQSNIALELDTLMHAEVGQREAIFAALKREFYGRPVGPEALVPDAWPEGTIVLLWTDRHLDDTIDVPAWRERLRIIDADERFTLGRLGPAPSPPGGGGRR